MAVMKSEDDTTSVKVFCCKDVAPLAETWSACGVIRASSLIGTLIPAFELDWTYFMLTIKRAILSSIPVANSFESTMSPMTASLPGYLDCCTKHWMSWFVIMTPLAHLPHKNCNEEKRMNSPSHSELFFKAEFPASLNSLRIQSRCTACLHLMQFSWWKACASEPKHVRHLSTKISAQAVQAITNSLI